MKQDELTGMYYDYAMAAPLMLKDKAADQMDVLILGMGTGTYATQCRKYFGDMNIEGVEIDEKITDLSRKYFSLSEDVPVTTYDGRAFLNASQKAYDVIMVDAYQDITIPFQMSSKEFFALVKSHLKDDGVMVVQISFQHIGTVQGHADFFHMHAHPAFAFMQNGTFHISNILLYLFAAASGCYTLHACGPTLTKKSRPKAARKPRWGFQCFTNRKLLSGLFGGLLGGILDHSSLGFNSTSLVDGLCIGQNVTSLLLNFADGLHGGVLHAQHGSSGLGVDLLGVLAGQQLETGRTEQSAGGEQCDLLDIHSNFPTFSISCQRPCTAGPVR